MQFKNKNLKGLCKTSNLARNSIEKIKIIYLKSKKTVDTNIKQYIDYISI